MDAMEQLIAPDLSDRPESNVRKSVFDRLATSDDRLKLDFADVVGNEHADGSLSFFPLKDKVQTHVRIPVELATKVMNTHKTTLFGYFLGPRLPFPIVEKYVKAVWGKYGCVEAMMNNNGIYFFKFNDVGGSKQVVETGPLMIRGVPLFVSHWDPALGLSKPIHTTCPLWVKLHNVPLVAFNKEGISRIASTLGVPKQMDACTATMCDKAWGRPGFAKVLVDTWAVGELKREIHVVVPSLTGGVDVTVVVRVEYLWEPTQCTHCLVFGHKASTCGKALSAAAAKPKAKESIVDEDGFTRVTRKEWRAKQNNNKSTYDHGTTSGSSPSVEPTVQLEGEVEKDVEQSVVEAELPKEKSKVVPEVVTTIGEALVDDATKNGVDQGGPCKATVVKDLNKEKVSIPPKLPIRGILKNPNRFSALANDPSSGARGESVSKGNSPTGLNAFEKQQEVRSLIRNNNLSICAVLESHVRVESLRTICASSFGRWDWVSNQAMSDYGTRIIIAWDVSNVDVMVLESHRQYMHCEVRIRGLMHGFFISFVYGDNRGIERRNLWSGLRRFKAIMGDKPWVIAGDFNCLLFPHDAFGGISRRNTDMADFASCLEDIDAFDVRFTGIHHTWHQKPNSEGGLKRKLDRILANTFFTSLFVDATARFLPRGLSDHSPGIIGFTGGTRAMKASFKFDNFLANDPQFLATVERLWNVQCEGTFMFRLTSKLKSLKTPLRKLRSAYGSLSARTRDLKEDLDVAQLSADLDPGNNGLAQEVKRIREAYQKSCWVDLSASRQRAKVKWLAEGDANTRYFHRVIEERQHSRHIHSVCNAAGEYVFDDDVAMAFIDHFMSIIGTKDLQVIPEMSDSLFQNRLSMGNSIHMIRVVQDSEIRDALFSIGNDKAPGSDGFSSKFFKAAWGIVGTDVLVAIHNFFYRGHLAKELNHTLLCLLPKSPNATSVSDFRPIACCSVLYKCISKVLVGRLKPYLDGLINKAQSAFIPGRKIGDNILMAHELVSGYHLERGPPRCAFKIDLRKAYDMVSWDYLFCMLKGFGFHPTFIKWITEMVSTPSFSIVVNGESRGFFQGKRGIRQGDPLSPYLFTLVMEGFSMLFKQCIEEATDFGYHHGCEEFGITHLCFADDLFVFTRGDVPSVEVLKKTLSLFASKSGLSPNLQKSDIFFGNVTHDEQAAILYCLPFRSGSFPIRYLGVPLSPVALKTADYGVLVTRVKGRIQNWKSKFLSFGGRKQLICSVLQSLQLYWMAIYLLPSGVVHEIESLCRDFLWAQGDSSKGRCKVAWATVCRPKECGGLGFRRLATWNRALVVKNLWSLVSNRDCLWVNWIRNYALRNMGLWTARKNNRWSWVLTKMMGIREDVRRFVSVRVGDGQTTNAWEDAWLPCGPLSEFVPHRFIHAHSFSVGTTVKQLLDTFHDGWPDYWVNRFPELATVALPTLQNDVQDACCWNIDANGNGKFTVQRAYYAFEGEHPIVPWWRMVWFKAHIPKHSFCLWTACLNRLPTQDRIAAWKEEPPDMRCSLCGISRDSHDHLFFECSFSRQIWLQVMDKVQWVDFPCSWSGIVGALSNPDTAPKHLEHKLALAASVYVVWCERNSRLFRGDSKPIPHLVRMILDSVLDRVAWKQRKTSLRPNGVAI
ncbi:hypothetical protein OSB04_un000877 [Centaurea solstitialis]|uniref:Reverse transcriptase domain-containing protein n=1 Tax=Centaurea solstitialis TaxID=347529 RepID=A0AA38S5E0_9ASTR|nr:hypothetical protein OSB04_un000877 [Centaurea solstitialis]